MDFLQKNIQILNNVENHWKNLTLFKLAYIVYTFLYIFSNNNRQMGE